MLSWFRSLGWTGESLQWRDLFRPVPEAKGFLGLAAQSGKTAVMSL